MNGPFHYTEAERLLYLADVGEMERDGMRDRLIAAAQAHATLALAAATLAAPYIPEGDSTYGWLGAIADVDPLGVIRADVADDVPGVSQ